ncbi:MAG: tRNA 5-methoxyuridine(34)/uridine 5-oxyacetic acid(34) synthase CmoB [Thiotrichales bacterium]
MSNDYGQNDRLRERYGAGVLNLLREQTTTALEPARHGHLTDWQNALGAISTIKALHVDVTREWIEVGRADDLTADQQVALHATLRALMPWRKGPFTIFGIPLDSEWRSDMKWRRLLPHIQPLRDRWVLDVGCGNGYYALRMLGAGAAQVIGIDPTPLYVMQFNALAQLAGPLAATVLPLTLEALDPKINNFDTVFSMGVIYHRRSPIDHLMQLHERLRPGGELVLETLVVDGERDRVLLPQERYAKMRNVWFIPSVPALESWLHRCRFDSVRCVDVEPTTIEEQRRTDWSNEESLIDFLDPEHPEFTIEQYPAPRRAALIAQRRR